LCKVRILLADDHQEVIARVRGTLGEEFEIVGTVEILAIHEVLEGHTFVSKSRVT
jgi:hypothetical protein